MSLPPSPLRESVGSGGPSAWGRVRALIRGGRPQPLVWAGGIPDGILAGTLQLDPRSGGPFRLVTTDVFDTLLLRTWQSERSRLQRGDRLFSRVLAQHGFEVSADRLLDARLLAQRLAFRALDVRRLASEVKLIDIVERQLAILNLPAELAQDRLDIELAVEKASLVANPRLAEALTACKQKGARIAAVSDTTLSGAALKDLIRHFYGPDLIDTVYSSADHGMTKRRGDIFAAVARREGVGLAQMLHIGDDPIADVKVPASRGLAVQHVPRSAVRTYARRVNGAAVEAQRLLRRQAPAAKPSAYHDARSFGREILGPIVAELCLCIWLYAKQSQACNSTALLFCARGGIGMREAFERLLAKMSLTLECRRETLMISRLVAARAALLQGHASAIEELDREFRGSTFAHVAEALGGGSYILPETWKQPFRAKDLLGLLRGTCGSPVLADMQRQHDLFRQHLEKAAGDAEILLLCDTGLYGSTLRLLATALPQGRVEAIQFARSNYKCHDEAHFARTTGLLVQRKYFSPLDIRSSVLRYWHLIESLFEPAVPSVRFFEQNRDGGVSANSGPVSYGAIHPAQDNPLLGGALAYIDELPALGTSTIFPDATVAWPRLKRAICYPTSVDLRCLAVGPRSRDFGRAEKVEIFGAAASGESLVARLRATQRSLWREGALAHDFPHLKHLLLPLLDGALSLRGLVKR